MDSIRIFDVKIDLINSSEILSNILELSINNRRGIISHVNVHGLNIAYENDKMRELFSRSYLTFIDGDGVNYGAKILNLPTGPKVTYDWWIWELAEFSQYNDLSWYILGANEESLKKATDNLQERYDGLNIKGYHNGYFNKKNIENQVIVDEINNLKPNILLVGMGMPIQEEWLLDNFDKLDVNVALTCGAAIDYISGEFRSTPKIFRDLKFEWFYRLMRDPKRLFNRYVIGNPLFFYRVFAEKYFK